MSRRACKASSLIAAIAIIWFGDQGVGQRQVTHAYGGQRFTPVLWIPSGERVPLMPRLRRTSAGQNSVQQILVQATGPSTLQDLQSSPCVQGAQIANSDLLAIVLNETTGECENILEVWRSSGSFQGVYVMPENAKISEELQDWEDDQDQAKPAPASGVADGVAVMTTLVLESPAYAATLAHAWRDEWPGCILRTEVPSSRKILVKVARRKTCVHKVVNFLAAQDMVSWIERMRVASLKLKYAVSMVQGGYWKTWKRSTWDADLKGDGEIIGIGDSGLDYDNCYFRDPSNSPQVCTMISGTSCANSAQPAQHNRKVVAYRGKGVNRADVRI